MFVRYVVSSQICSVVSYTAQLHAQCVDTCHTALTRSWTSVCLYPQNHNSSSSNSSNMYRHSSTHQHTVTACTAVTAMHTVHNTGTAAATVAVILPTLMVLVLTMSDYQTVVQYLKGCTSKTACVRLLQRKRCRARCVRRSMHTMVCGCLYTCVECMCLCEGVV